MTVLCMLDVRQRYRYVGVIIASRFDTPGADQGVVMDDTGASDSAMRTASFFGSIVSRR